MSGDRQVVASAYGASVQVSAPAGVIAALTQLVSPYIDVAPVGGLVDAPHVQVCASPPSQDVWRRMVLESEYEPDRVVWVDAARRRMALTDEHEDWTVQQLLRSVRYLLRWQAYARGDLFLHGGLVRAEDTGIAFLGHKRSGKTSSILSALLHGGADFVSNDDVVLTDSDDETGALTGHGSPRTVNVRTDALLALARDTPALLSLLSDTSHPTNDFPGRHRTRDAIHSSTGDVLPGSVWVRCAELSHVTGRSLLPESRVDMVVLPRFDSALDGPVMTRLTPQEAYRALSEHVEETATKYDPYLAAWFPATDADRRARLLRRLADGTPCYQLTQDIGRLADATSLLLATRAAAGPVA
ncbi:hypothetical protein [Streptomyces sviceus]|uniref:hypothetical protein n=1 Tax=Streptomyces sviceus TaxID=285530 RepID=UPI00332CBA8D